MSQNFIVEQPGTQTLQYPERVPEEPFKKKRIESKATELAPPHENAKTILKQQNQMPKTEPPKSVSKNED